MTDVIARLTAALGDRYRVEREVGQGGMASVYLAHDIRHDRKVAIKVLHEDLGATLGPERFLTEIKTTAKLQHPHILPLLDSGSTAADGRPGGLLYYVMPFVEGESLRDRLDREKQLPIEDAVRIAREVGDALGLAHGHGIIHRDIKPENILLQGGHALVADFGIALAVQHAGGSRLTQTGLSLGTPQYMSPEQAMGEKSVDGRADVYALGAVTYEMLVGEPPFTGATVQAIVAKVLSSEPEPPTTMRKTIPAHVEDAVLRALAKLPADRFPSVEAFGAALGGAASGGGTRTVSRQVVASNVGRVRAWAVTGGTIGIFAGVALGWFALRGAAGSGATAELSRVYITQPAAEALPSGTSDFAISPTGADLVYVGPGEQTGTTQLWRKRRADLHATRIDGTVAGYAPFFSPDGKWVAFSTRTGLSKIPVDGGSPSVVSPELAFALGHGTWLDDGRIVGQSRVSVGIMPADGGKVERLTSSSKLAGYNPVQLAALPGGKAVLVQSCPPGCARSNIYTLDIASKAVHRIVDDGRNPAYLPSGHIAYIATNGQLMIAPFDAKTLEIRGEARPVIDHVSAFAVTRTGDLVYREGDPGSAVRPVWVDHAGKTQVIDSSWVAQISSLGLSPDGKRLAVSVVARAEQELWIKDLPNGSLSKFTFDAGDHFRPTWSADGKVIRYVHGQDGKFEFLEKNANGTGEARRVPYGDHQVVDATPSRDGAWLAMRVGAGDTLTSLLAIRLGVDTIARQVGGGGVYKQGLALSPDSRFIAYQSSVSGQPEVYVSPFPDVGAARWQVSRNTGLEPRWSLTGSELYFVTDRDEFVAATYTATPAFAVTSSKTLFDVSDFGRDGGYHAYDVAADGRFLMLKHESFPGQLVLVTNWFSELRDKLKASK